MSVSRDLTCNETLSVEDSERILAKDPVAVSRKFQVASAPSRGSFRVAFPAPRTTYTAIARPVASRAYSVATTATNVRSTQSTNVGPTTVMTAQPQTVHRSYTVASQGSSANNKLLRTYSTSESNDYSAGVPSTSHQNHATQSTYHHPSLQVLRTVHRDLPNSHSPTAQSTQLNMYINTMRLQQTQPQVATTGCRLPQMTAVGAQQLPVQRAAIYPGYSSIRSPSLVSTTSRSTYIPSPVLQHHVPAPRNTPPANGNKLMMTSSDGTRMSASPVVPQMLPPSSPAPARSNYNTQHLQSSVSASVPGSPLPIPQSLVNHNVSTPSPRPSILRKNTTPGSAKRKLPLKQGSASPPLYGNTTPGPSVRNIIQNATAASTSVAMALNAVGMPQANGHSEETPRKRLRKQQFDLNQPPEQIRMAIGVEPIRTAVWDLSGHHSTTAEKRKRGRPRSDSRPATAMPEPYYIQTGVRHVFVPLEGLDKKVNEGNDSVIVRDVCPSTRVVALSVPPVHFKEKTPDTSKSSTDASQSASTVDRVNQRECKSKSRRMRSKSSSLAQHKLFSNKAEMLLSGADGAHCSEDDLVLSVASFLANEMLRHKKEVQVDRKHPDNQKSSLRFSKSDRQLDSLPQCSSDVLRDRDQDLRSNHFEAVELVNDALTRRHSSKKMMLLKARMNRQTKLRARNTAEKLVSDSEKLLKKFCDDSGVSGFDDLTPEARIRVIHLLEHTLLDRTTAAKKYITSIMNSMKKEQGDDSVESSVERSTSDSPLSNEKTGAENSPDYCTQTIPPGPISLVGTMDSGVEGGSDADGLLLFGAVGKVSSSFEDFPKVSHRNKSFEVVDDKLIVDQLLDEMIGFVSNPSVTQRNDLATRLGTRVLVGHPLSSPSSLHSVMAARRSRARLFTSEAFSSVIECASQRQGLHESNQVMDNVYVAGEHYKNRDWWSIVSNVNGRSNKNHRRQTRSTDILEDLCLVSGSVAETIDRIIMKITGTTLTDVVRLQLEQLGRRVNEQMGLEHNLLCIFEKFLKAYDPESHFQLLLDIARDYEEGDTKDLLEQKRFHRLRQTLLAPPIKLALDKKPDFGDTSASVIINPSEEQCNLVLKTVSPFWRGQSYPDDELTFDDKRIGGYRMLERCDDFVPLEDDHQEYYKEDVSNLASENMFMQQFSEFETFCLRSQLIPPLNPSISHEADDKYELDTRCIRHTDGDEAEETAGSQKAHVPDIPSRDPCSCPQSDCYIKDPLFVEKCRSSRELLATTLKAVHETTLVMIQSRDSLAEHLGLKSPSKTVRRERSETSSPRKEMPWRPKRLSNRSRRMANSIHALTPDGNGYVNKKDKTTPLRKPRPPRTPVITESTFERQIRKAIQESLRAQPSISKS